MQKIIQTQQYIQPFKTTGVSEQISTTIGMVFVTCLNTLMKVQDVVTVQWRSN